MKIKVVRAFLHRGERQDPGKTIEVTDMLGRELVNLGKAERAADDKSAPAPKTMTTKSVPALTGGDAKE